MTNFTQLKSDIGDWVNRTDLTAKLPNFILFAENRINRKLRLRTMETRVTLDTITGQRYYALPDRYAAMRNFKLNTSPMKGRGLAAPTSTASTKKVKRSRCRLPLRKPFRSVIPKRTRRSTADALSHRFWITSGPGMGGGRQLPTYPYRGSTGFYPG